MKGDKLFLTVFTSIARDITITPRPPSRSSTAIKPFFYTDLQGKHDRTINMSLYNNFAVCLFYDLIVSLTKYLRLIIPSLARAR